MNKEESFLYSIANWHLIASAYGEEIFFGFIIDIACTNDAVVFSV